MTATLDCNFAESKSVFHDFKQRETQSAFTYSKPSIKILEHGVKYFQN